MEKVVESKFYIDEQRPWIGIVKYAMPILVSSVIQQLYNAVDLFVLGICDSQNAMASVGACGFLIGMLTVFATGLSSGISVITSTDLGKNEADNIKPLVQNSLFITAIFGIIAALFLRFIGPFLLTGLIDVPAELLNDSYEYIKICAIGIIFVFLYNYCMGLLLGHGDSKISMLFLCTSATINIVLDIVSVRVFSMGVKGVALATIIAQICAFIFATIYLKVKYPGIISYFITNKWCLYLDKMLNVIKVGIPLSVQGIVVNLGYMVIQKTVNSYGSDMTASYSMASKLEMYMLIPFISFTSASIVYVGYLLGQNKTELVKKIMKEIRGTYLVFAIIWGCVAFMVAPFIADIFNLSSGAAALFISHFRMISVDIIIYSLYSPVNVYFGGIKKTYLMLICSCVEMSGRIISINILSRTIGAACVWLSEPIPWIIVCIMMNVVYWRKRLK